MTTDVASYLEQALSKLEQHLFALEQRIEPPVIAKIGKYLFPRHRTRSDSLLCFLKCTKLVSTMNAAVLLLRRDFAQEVNALCRMADDFQQEIMFWMGPEEPTPHHRRMFDDFFQEEFADPGDPLGSHQARSTVPRQKVNAAFGRLAQDELNPATTQKMLTTIHKALSGYVHGSYTHIMEMFGGFPPRFQVSGVPERRAETTSNLVNYVYRSIMVSELVARKLGAEDIRKSVRALLEAFESDMNCAPDKDAALAKINSPPS